MLVYDFPLFEWDEDLKNGSSSSCFSSPKTEHLDFLISDPGKVRTDLFDLVCNGMEMGSGSIRIHDPNIQKKFLVLLAIKKKKLMIDLDN